MPTDPAKLLQKYRDEGYNILTPSITLDGLSERHKATVETISLSPDPDIGDVYKHQEGRFIISKQGLDKLAVLADIIWDKDECKRIDDKSNRDYIAYKAFGAIKKADGKYVPAVGYKDMDFLVEREELEFKYLNKARKANKSGEAADEYVKYCVTRDMIHKRKYGGEMCESGARNRVTRALLGVLKGYTQKQLQKPFVVIKITYQPDYDDPEIKKLMTYLSATAQTNIFGPLPNAPMLPAPTITQDKSHKEEYSTEDAIIVEDDNIPDAQNGDVVLDEDVPGDLQDGEAEFALWDRKSQEAEINSLAKRKGYALQGLLDRMAEKQSITKAKLSAVDDIPLIQIYDKIKLMKDKPRDDDIPF